MTSILGQPLIVRVDAGNSDECMNSREHADAVRARERRAREREARAVSHQRAAVRKADTASDPIAARAHLAEADMHARAAQVHHEAAELQGSHAREHEV